MISRYNDGFVTIYCGDGRDMSEIPDEVVQCVVTSPPYWGLRKYAGEQEMVWGAWRGAYGLEPTPEMYVQHTIEILREIRRVLRKDGVVFWNIGDSYAGSGVHAEHHANPGISQACKRHGAIATPVASGLKPKDLCLSPARVALAAQADGWWVRCDVIWNKPNPMPESVTDRPTNSHEYIWIFTKSGTPQYWTHRDHAGTRQKPKADWRWVNEKTKEEVSVEPPDWREKVVCLECNGEKNLEVDIGLGIIRWEECDYCHGKGEVKLWKRINLWRGHDYYWDQDAVREPQTGGAHSRGTEACNEAYQEARGSYHGFYSPIVDLSAGRNIRSVWEFPTKPYPEAHFAVFPDELPRKCIMAATPPKCCAECGAPWGRVVDKPDLSERPLRNMDKADGEHPHVGWDGYPRSAGQAYQDWRNSHPDVTVGWRPTCDCNVDTKPSLVLDPMAGSGTVGKVAKELGRKAILIDISEEYCGQAIKRLEAVPVPMAMEL